MDTMSDAVVTLCTSTLPRQLYRDLKELEALLADVPGSWENVTELFEQARKAYNEIAGTSTKEVCTTGKQWTNVKSNYNNVMKRYSAVRDRYYACIQAAGAENKNGSVEGYVSSNHTFRKEQR
jgi:hypothetical protein